MTEDVYEWARDRAEAEYFAHVDPLPTTTHLVPRSCIVSSNELDLSEAPF